MSQTFLSFFKKPLPWNPWVYFGFFSTADSLLSYSSTPKIWVCIFGLLFPFAIGLQDAWAQRHNPKVLTLFSNDLFNVPFWFWGLCIFLLLFTRFYRLTTLPFWPLSDEGIETFVGMNLSKQWSWNLLWTPVRVEPLMYWTLGLYFKLVPPSLFSIRLFPAVISIFTALTAYWAIKPFFSRSLTFLVVWSTAFSFWEFTLSRFCSLVILVPILEFLCFGLLFRFSMAKNSSTKWTNLILLGILGGLAFYSWTNWAGVWLCLLTVIVVQSFHFKPARLFSPMIFVILSASLVLPLVLARLAPGEMSRINTLNGWASWKTLPLYIENLFWNGSASFPFGSNWGGFLNPIWGALVLTGYIYLLRSASKSISGVATVCLLLAVLPAILANGVEIYRILPIFPLLMVLAALGLSALIRSGPSNLNLSWMTIPPGVLRLNLILPFVLLGGSLGLDLNNYIFHYCDIAHVPAERQWRTVEYADAYQILKSLSQKTGPLYVFSEFNMDYDNKTLNIAVYPFDVLQNPKLSNISPRWTAVIINVHYAEYFLKNFHGVQYKVLNSDREVPAPFGLFLIPVSEIQPQVLNDWFEADKVYRKAVGDIKNKRPMDSWSSFSESDSSLKNQLLKDPLLTSVNWEKRGFFQFLDHDFKSAAQSYRNAIQQGYPAAHLYYNYGFCLKLMGDNSGAQKAFEQSAQTAKESLTFLQSYKSLQVTPWL